MITVSAGFDRNVISADLVQDILQRSERILRAFVEEIDHHE